MRMESFAPTERCRCSGRNPPQNVRLDGLPKAKLVVHNFPFCFRERGNFFPLEGASQRVEHLILGLGTALV